MLAVHQLMLLCLTRRRTTGSGDHVLRSEVALLRTSPRPLYWPQCIYSSDSILLSRSVHEAVASGWFCFCHRRVFLFATDAQWNCPPCCVVLALCRHATDKPWLSSVGSHHAATCLPCQCHRYAVSVHTMLRRAYHQK